MMCYVVLYHDVLCCVIPSYVTVCCTMMCYVVLYHDMLWCVVP